MIYRIACVGRIKEQHFTQMLNEYKKEIDKRGRLEICEVPDERIPQKAGDKVNAMIIEAEADRLIQRRRVLEHNMRRMQEYLALVLDGEKFSSPRCTVSYRWSEGTETDPEFVDWAREHRPELLMEQQPKIDTQQLKRELKDGLVCDYARLVERQNVQVR